MKGEKTQGSAHVAAAAAREARLKAQLRANLARRKQAGTERAAEKSDCEDKG